MTPSPSDDYVARVNRAIDHVIAHLAEPLRLENVAKVACFSPFHFHRIFRALMDETLNDFIKRLRLERALHLMSHHGESSITTVAHRCGFSSSSDFSRSFKQRFGVPPSEFDLETHRRIRRAELKERVPGDLGGNLLAGLPAGENPDAFRAEIIRVPARTVAYLRVLDPFRSEAVPEACRRLVAWAEERNHADGQWLGYMWDDPELVALEDCRYDVGLVVPKHCPVPLGSVGRMEFPELTIAKVVVRGGIDLEQRAIDWLFKTWLPRSSFVPDEQPCFEAWVGRPFAQGLRHFELDLHLPIRRH